MQLGGGGKTPDSTAVAGATRQDADDGLKHCATPLGTASIVEDTTAPWYSVLTGQYQLGSTVPVLKMLVQQSNCFVIVDRGRALNAALAERQLNDSRELRKTSKMHKGQMVAADYGMSPSITFSTQNTGGASSLLAYMPVVGSALAGVAGSMNTKEAPTVAYASRHPLKCATRGGDRFGEQHRLRHARELYHHQKRRHGRRLFEHTAR
jgi:type IV secretory pathway TrbL component